MEFLSHGDRILKGSYSVHSRFNRAVNFEGCGTLISLVDTSIGGGPINLVIDTLDAAVCPAKLCVENDRFVLGNHALRKEADRLYCSALGLGAEDSERFCGNLKFLGRALRTFAPFKSLAFLLAGDCVAGLTSGYERGFSARMREGLRHMMEGRLAEGARTFRGAGFGLTPSGDDFLSGFLLGLNSAEMIWGKDLGAAKEMIYENAIGASLIVNSSLVCARDGRVFERFKNLVSALARSSDEDIGLNARRLFEVGETSGADMATGFYFSVSLFGFTAETLRAQRQQGSPCLCGKALSEG